MPNVLVKETALVDPRIEHCAKSLYLARDALLCGLIQLWSHVTLIGTDRVHKDVVGVCLKAGTIADVDEVYAKLVASGLAEKADDDYLSLHPLSQLFGDYTWYTRRQSTVARKRPRVQTPRPNADPKDLPYPEAEVLAALDRLRGRSHIGEIAATLKTGPDEVRPHLKSLVKRDLVTECSKDTYVTIIPF